MHAKFLKRPCATLIFDPHVLITECKSFKIRISLAEVAFHVSDALQLCICRSSRSSRDQLFSSSHTHKVPIFFLFFINRASSPTSKAVDCKEGRCLQALYNYPYWTMGDFSSHRFLALHQSTSSSILVLHYFNSCWKQEGTMGQWSVATSHQTKPLFITLIIFFLFFPFFQFFAFWGLGHGNWHGVCSSEHPHNWEKKICKKRGKIETRGFLWLTCICGSLQRRLIAVRTIVRMAGSSGPFSIGLRRSNG